MKTLFVFRLKVDIVARRGVLAELLRAADRAERVDVYVTLYRGTLFMEGQRTFQPDTPENRKNAFTGHKFKQYVTSGEIILNFIIIISIIFYLHFRLNIKDYAFRCTGNGP